MPLFQCEKCGAVENTATGSFWGQVNKLCSECSTGKWHGMFAKKNAEAEGYYRDEHGFIYAPDEIDLATMEWTYNRKHKIVGRC